MEEEKKTYQETEIIKVKVDFDKLESWVKPGSDNLPVYSFLSLYEACGLEEHIRKYSEEHNNLQFVAADNLLCTFYTLQHLKFFIENQWKIYSLDINEDNHVVWDTRKYGKHEKHYARKLSKKLQSCINADFMNFCPGIMEDDDSLGDDEISFRIYTKE